MAPRTGQHTQADRPTQPADTAGAERAVFTDLARPDAIDQICTGLAAEHGLSSREAQICSYLARGRSQTYIRDAPFLSKNTVATHVRRLYAKLGVHSKQQLIDLVEKRRQPPLPIRAAVGSNRPRRTSRARLKGRACTCGTTASWDILPPTRIGTHGS